jgi:hypothetical protein
VDQFTGSGQIGFLGQLVGWVNRQHDAEVKSFVGVDKPAGRNWGSVRAKRRESAQVSSMLRVKAFLRYGRFSRIVAIPSSIVYSRSAMAQILSGL